MRWAVQTKRGITLLEMVVVFAIVAILAAIVLPFFSGFRESKVLDTGVENVVSALNAARLDTLSSKSDTQYGVHMESARMVIFPGAAFAEPNPDNVSVSVDPALEISSISLSGGGSDVVFERLSGKTSQNGTVVIRVKSSPAKNVTITIEPTGVVTF